MVLQCFNPLDDLSRKNAFEVMGWPRDNYLKRQEILRQQLENAKKEKMKKEEEAKEDEGAKTQQPEDQAVDGEGKTNEDQKGETANDEGEGPTKDTEEVGVEEKNETEEKVETDDNDKVTSEETKTDDNDGTKENGDSTINRDEKGEGGVEGKPDSKAQEKPKIDDNDNPLLLPLLSAPIDPQTLLDRLNTRRLYARILHFKREQKRKVEEEAAKLLSGDDVEDASGGSESGVPGMGGPIQKMYRDLLKEKVTADRIWRKNMTIEEMANLEWDELLRVAELR